MVNKLIFANLFDRPLRTFLSVLAIGVEVTMILTLVGVSYGTLDASARRARGIGADVFLRPPNSSIMSLTSSPLPDKLVGKMASEPGVTLATGTMISSLAGLDTIQGVNFDEMNKMASTWRKPGDPVKDGFKFLEGGPMQADDDLIVDEFYAKQKKIHPGDHITLLNHSWRLAGVFESGKLARILCRIDVLQHLTANEHRISAIYIKLDDPKKADAFVVALKHELNGDDVEHGYQIYTVEEFVSQLSVNSVPMLQDFIYVVIGVASVVGFIVVFMAMYTAVLERTREIGILKAVGASGAYILNILFRETLLIAIFGTAFGILLTYVTQFMVAHAVPASLVQETVYSWWPISAAIAIGGAVIGTIVPAMRAVKLDATEALSYE